MRQVSKLPRVTLWPLMLLAGPVPLGLGGASGLPGIVTAGVVLAGAVRGLGAAEGPAVDARPSDAPPCLAELVARLRARYPDRESVTEHADEIAGELLAFAEREDAVRRTQRDTQRSAEEGGTEGSPEEGAEGTDEGTDEGTEEGTEEGPDEGTEDGPDEGAEEGADRVAGESPGGRPQAGRARLLAAEVLSQAGRDRDALALLTGVARDGPTDDDRAKALFLLGERSFFQGRFAPVSGGRSRGSALESWAALADRYPESVWARRVERPLRYLRLLDGATAPAFEETFLQPEGAPGPKGVDTGDPGEGDPGEKDDREEVLGQDPVGEKGGEDIDRAGFGAQGVRISSSALRGKVVALDFWRSSTSSQEEFERILTRDLLQAFADYPELAGRIVVLGINLDADRTAFEDAVEDWGIPWPQHHDGKGFETPLAQLFGIPREPHLLVIDPEGRIAYIGADSQRFFAVLSREAKRLRGVPEEQEE